MLLEFLVSVLPFLWPVARWVMLGALICLPLALFRRTRGFAALALYVASVVLGLATWVWGLIVTWMLWGGFAVVIGLFLLGVGVVPMGIAAGTLAGEWWLVLNMCVTLAVWFGARMFSHWLDGHSG